MLFRFAAAILVKLPGSTRTLIIGLRHDSTLLSAVSHRYSVQPVYHRKSSANWPKKVKTKEIQEIFAVL
jgi:hypothetical protein